MVSFRIATLVSLVLLAVTCGQACGEVRQVKVAAKYLDFAMHPQTGTIAALDTESNRVDIYQLHALAGGEAEPTTRVTVGTAPSAIVYKRFKDVHLFSVVCAQDSYMYLIDAGSPKSDSKTEFKLLKKIVLPRSGGMHVACSTNPDDPFLYYTYRNRREANTGVVSLRDMRDRGKVFESTKDCMISADGTVAYLHGPHSPSGLEAHRLENSLSDDKPQFGRLFYDHTTSAEYLPCPFGRYTAVGQQMFSSSLSKLEATLNIVPGCFFRSQPFIVGSDAPPRMQPHPTSTPRSGAKLQIASYNSLKTVGDPVVLPSLPSTDESQSKRSGFNGGMGGFPPRDPLKPTHRPRLFADDVRRQVLHAEGEFLSFVPLEDFNVQDEAIALAELKGDRTFTCGQESELLLTPLDHRAKVVVDDMPNGMEFADGKLTWRPEMDQVGNASIAVTTKWGELEKSQRFDLKVEYPSRQLPFVASGFSVTPSGKHIAIWDGFEADLHGRRQASGEVSARLAILDWETGKIIAQRKVAESIGWLAFSDENIFVVAWGPTTQRCEVLRRSDLERVATIVASSPILNMEVGGGVLVLQTEKTTKVHNASTLEHMRTFQARGDAGSNVISEVGIHIDHVLYGFDLSPKLIGNVGSIPAIGGRRREHVNTFPSAGEVTENEQRLRRGMFNRGWEGRIAEAKLPGVAIALEQNHQQSQVPGAIHTWTNELEIVVVATGSVHARQRLVYEETSPRTGNRPQLSPCIMQVNQQAAFILHEAKLYRWGFPKPNEGTILPTHMPNWSYDQSAVSISAAGKTELTHELKGGKPPITYSTTMSPSHATLDEKSGTITLNNDALAEDGLDAIVASINRENRGESYTQTLRTKAESITPQAMELLGRRPTGFPVAVPIHISASDANLASRTLNYFAIVEVPAAKLMSKMREADQARAKRFAAAKSGRADLKNNSSNGPATTVAGELKSLKLQVESLEQRLDLMTRQMNILLKKLDEK
ncbi:MAG: hypothetical protein Aurels2KO_01040 [Aureliella sp.]